MAGPFRHFIVDKWVLDRFFHLPSRGLPHHIDVSALSWNTLSDGSFHFLGLTVFTSGRHLRRLPLVLLDQVHTVGGFVELGLLGGVALPVVQILQQVIELLRVVLYLRHCHFISDELF